jgi:hypothetical protein
MRGHGGRVFGKDRCVIEVALAKSDTLSVFEINCGDQQHIFCDLSLSGC